MVEEFERLSEAEQEIEFPLSSDRLPGFDLDNYPESNFSTKIWDKAGFNPLEAVRNESYCLDNQGCAKIFLRENLTVNNDLLSFAIDIATIINYPIQWEVIDFALMKGGLDRESALLYLAENKPPSSIHIKRIIEIIEFCLENFYLFEGYSDKTFVAIKALSNFRTSEIARAYLKNLPQHEKAKSDKAIQNFIKMLITLVESDVPENGSEERKMESEEEEGKQKLDPCKNLDKDPLSRKGDYPIEEETDQEAKLQNKLGFIDRRQGMLDGFQQHVESDPEINDKEKSEASKFLQEENAKLRKERHDLADEMMKHIKKEAPKNEKKKNPINKKQESKKPSPVLSYVLNRITPKTRPRLKAHGSSDIGRVREVNEDHFQWLRME